VSKFGGEAVGLVFTPKISRLNPFITVWHEVGHFLDHKAFGQPGGAFATDSGALASREQREAFTKLKNAISNSQARKTLDLWRDRALYGRQLDGDGVIPLGVTRGRTYLNYLTTDRESFARAYAQYMVVTSMNAEALAALRRMQAASTTGPVARNTRFNSKSIIHADVPDPNSWDYPWQWQDADFEPIRAAFDELFRTMGWRK
jgi:hypothetical protein